MPPKTRKQGQGLDSWEWLAFRWIWIPSFGLIANPLYNLLQGKTSDESRLIWGAMLGIRPSGWTLLHHSETCRTLKSAALPPVSQDTLEHDCSEVIELVYQAGKLSEVNLCWLWTNKFVDSSTSIANGPQRAGHAILPLQGTVEATSLSPVTPTPEVEMLSLTRALEQGIGKMSTVSPDSENASMVVPAHRKIWEEKVLLNANNEEIKHGKDVYRLLLGCKKKQ